MNQRKSYWRWVTHLRLLLSGWKPRRRVWEQLKLPTSLSPFSAAERILTEFGNLKFGDKNEYVLLDPSVGERVEKEIRGYERVIGRRLFPIGVWEIDYLVRLKWSPNDLLADLKAVGLAGKFWQLESAESRMVNNSGGAREA
jgi:hypothetical protein